MARFDRTIPAGGEGKITLEVKTKGYQGSLHKTARVISNDPTNPQVIIGMKGKLWTPIHVDPQHAHLQGTLGERIETVVHLRGEKNEPLLLKLDSVSLHEEVTVELKEIEKSRSYELRVKNKLEKEGRYDGQVKLAANYPEKPEIVIRVSGYIGPAVEVRPETLNFGLISKERLQQLRQTDRMIRRELVVILNRGNDLKIEKVELEKSLFGVVTMENQKGRAVRFVVEPILENLKTGLNSDRLKIYTNQKSHKVLEVPIRFVLLEEAS